MVSKLWQEEITKKQKKFYSTDSLNERKCEIFSREYFADCSHAGVVRTPYWLCEQIVDKLPNLNDKSVLIWFNPEFYLAVVNKYPNARITLVSGSVKASTNNFLSIRKIIACEPQDFAVLGRIMRRELMKFDCVIGNPPYQDPKNERLPLWEKFVRRSFELCKDDGHIALIHPCAWRKPIHKLFPLFQAYDLKYLEIHDQKDGQKTFGAGTRYDWYVAKKSKNRGRSVVVDEEGEKVICDLAEMGCIPHKNLELFESMLARKGERKCDVLFSYSAYETRKPWISLNEAHGFNHPVIHATRTKGPRIIRSSKNDNGHFGVKKVIMGMASPECGFFDRDGEYGMSQHVFGIPMNNDQDGKEFEAFLKTDKFKSLVITFKWAGFQTDHRAFGYLKYGFWRGRVG